MIYVARLLSLVGATLATAGGFALFALFVSNGFIEKLLANYSQLIVNISLAGGIALFAGQKLGNDLFRVRQIYTPPKDYDGAKGGHYGGGGDYGSGGGGDFGGCD